MAAQGSMQLGTEELTSPATLKAAFAEFVATGLFIFMGVGSVAMAVNAFGPNDASGVGVVSIAITHGLAIALLAGGIGGISGGHINPAVSFAMVLTGRITVTRGAMYVVAQLIGACVGMLLLRAFILDDVISKMPGAGGHAINAAAVKNAGMAVGIEAVLTFVLVWTIFATAVSSKGLGSLAAFAIGFAVLIDHLVGVPLTGASMNPARTFGPALINNRWTDHWVYWVGPLIGAAVAGITYWFFYLQDDET